MKFKNLKFSIYLVLSSLLIFSVSCIKDEDKEARDKENRLIQEYVQTNTGFVAQTSGMYFKSVYEGTGVKPTASDLVIFDYNARYLETLGYFDTSDRSEAALYSITDNTFLGTEGPLKIAIDGTYGFYSIGVSEALTKMKEGGIAYAIVPGTLALGNFTPFLYYLKLLKVISDPKQFEMDQISNYLQNTVTNMTLADSTTTGTTGLWFYDKTEGTGNLPVDGDSVDVKYTLSLLPYYESPYLVDVPEKTLVSNTTIKIRLNYTSLIDGFEGAVRLIKDQGKATVIIPYHRGYGYYVISSTSTGQILIPQYSTLIYDMQITRVKKN